MADTRSSGHHLDLESQQTVLLITGTNPPRVDHWRWIFVILQVRKLLISSRANRANKASPQSLPQLSSSAIHYTVISTVAAGDTPDLELTGTTEISPASPQVSGDVHLSRDSTASDAELQHANVAKIVKDKDFVSLQKFGGTRGIAEALNTDLQNGIPGDQEDICRRRMVNALSTTQAPAPSFFKLLLQSCNNYTIVLLFVAGLLSIGFGIKVEGLRTGWYEGAIIMFAILIHVIAPSIRDFWLENSHNHNAVIQTAGMSKNVVEAFRGGCPCELSVSDVVPGDLVCLKRGSVVPADGLFVSGEFLVLDDGMETTIDDKKPFMFYGAKVVSGNGRMLVTSVGMDTALGELMNRIAHTPNRAQLPAQLDKMNTRTQIAGLSISILLLVVLFFRFLLEKKDYSSGLPELKGKPAASKEIMNEMGKIVMKPSGQISILTTALAILLVGVVEGIPLFVTLAITYWNRKTMSGKAIAQGILACVTMGSVTTICTDKTGVLTLNSLEVDVCYIGNEVIENDCVTRIDTRVREALCNGICTPLLKPSSSCSSSEDPLLPWAANLGMEIEILRQSHTILEAKELRTNEEGSGVLMKKSSDNEGDMCLHWKGPATTILAMCSHYTDSRGTTKVMDEQRRLAFNHIVEHMQSKHLKTIAFAYKQTDVAKLEENSLILIGLLGVKYTCCEDIMEAVKACQEAGVNIILVSEEKVSKLKDIAVACGILANSNRLVLEGEKFRNSSAEERMDIVDKICVMGNSIPLDRLLLVQCLKEKDHAVAMVGVRTNETPTLKEADVGVAMGTWSSEMARESSDIIIWDGNFSFLVPIISCGRCIYYNIQKYIQLELTMNIAGLLITATTTMASGESAITAIQLFWANMVVTLLGGLALLMEPPTKELMEKPPVRRTDRLISKAMWRNIVSQALYQSAILVSFQLKGQTVPGISKKVSESIVFNSFVLCHVFNQVNSRELEKNKLKDLIIDWVQEGFQDFFRALDGHFLLLSGKNSSATQDQGLTEGIQDDKVLAGLVLVLAQVSIFIEQNAIPRITEEIAASFSGGGARGYEYGPAFVPGEICRIFHSAGEKFLHIYINMRTQRISVLLKKRFTTPNWVKHKEPREVHMFVDLFLQELEVIRSEVKQILPEGIRRHRRADSTGSTASSRSNPLREEKLSRSNTQRARSQLLETHLAKLFKQKVEIFTKVEFTQESVVTTLVKLCLKSLQEFVRLQTFNRSGFQQIQLDIQFLRTPLKEMAEDEAAVDFLLDEVIVAAAERCLDPIPLEPAILDKLIQAKLAKTKEQNPNTP